MERGSSQHTPRVDDQLAHETRSLTEGEPIEAHSRDDLLQEDPPEHTGNRPDVAEPTDDVDPDELDLRARLAASLRPSAFPADRDRLLAVAYEEQAPEEVTRLLERLPQGTVWPNVEEVWTAAGGHTEGRL